jgi:hypothetical protein
MSLLNDVMLRSVETFVQGVADDCIRANAGPASGAGMAPKIVRSTDGRCCKWCSDLAGEYYIYDAPDDIYRRHDNCTCTVTYISEKGCQDAHTKKWISRQETSARRARIAGDQAYIERLRRERDAARAGRIAKNIEKNDYLNSPENKANQIELRKRIESGEISLTLNPEMQQKHMLESHADGASYFDVSYKKLQEIINENHGTGLVYISRSGQIKEVIENEYDIGYSVDKETKLEEMTNRFTVHYSKGRTHATPARRRK